MNTDQCPTIHRSARTAVITAAGALTLMSAWALPASAGTPHDVVPAVGAVVTCQGVGDLIGSSGYLRQRETTTVDGRGRAHVLFTITTQAVVLAGADGSLYRLVGVGYDHVVYPGAAVSGNVVSEDERFLFDVIGADHVVGVVRFRLRTRDDQIPQITDSSTCQLPNMS